MNPTFTPTKVLISMFTISHLSRKHQELFSTIGTIKTGEWAPRYRNDPRLRPNHQRFRNYRWIEIGSAP